MASRGDWSTELWDICAQPGGPNMCCLSLWCPCVQYGLLLEQLPPGTVTCAGSVAGGCALFCTLWLLGDLLSAVLLTKIFTLPCTALVHSHARGYIRRKYGIQSHPLHDFCVTWCCAPCALCQEAREVVIRQAAEREDQARTPLLSRSSSVHDRDISTRSSLAGGRVPGLVSMGSGPEPVSPVAVHVAPAGGSGPLGSPALGGLFEAQSGVSAPGKGLVASAGGAGSNGVFTPSPHRTSVRSGTALAAAAGAVATAGLAAAGAAGAAAAAGAATVRADAIAVSPNGRASEVLGTAHAPGTH
ncbi:hypothetical protein PLESTB_000776300 [Pleodorina starrii]|uniref:Uncharacterized protein n=1 Tax=Pleodorina starrii TaxID=330485 RepID=A0A9W6F2X0_9CHLO|nr:hypothetical protein PLESTB_000776300 [Pleodorina starrii]GLC72869.1 hypothetical protein PLESTF_001304200 [Pleodorina starrii]